MAVLMTTTSVNVTTAGTRVALSGSTLMVYDLEVQAKAANTGKIYLGSVAVASSNGRQLTAGSTWSLSGLIDDASKSKNIQIDLGTLYIDSDVNGEGVIVSYLVR